MRRFGALRTARFALLTTLILIFTGTEALAARCEILYRFYNQNRTVAGPVNVECSWPHDDDGFGNWGVTTPGWGSRSNSHQFAGWKWRDSKWQWMSCTNEHPTPDCDQYNDNGCTTQKSTAVGIASIFVYKTKHGPNNYTCEQYFSGGTAVVTNLRKKLYELDAPDPDDHVTTQSYGTITVPITCSSAWSCSGWSTWKSTNKVDSGG
ncbi:MAG: hypothetical protein OXG44_03410 [Gammaproteobacteria bacterium]|nr:hypothetical protein [Gammaproteobacteria bacterium]